MQILCQVFRGLKENLLDPPIFGRVIVVERNRPMCCYQCFTSSYGFVNNLLDKGLSSTGVLFRRILHLSKSSSSGETISFSCQFFQAPAKCFAFLNDCYRCSDVHGLFVESIIRFGSARWDGAPTSRFESRLRGTALSGWPWLCNHSFGRVACRLRGW